MKKLMLLVAVAVGYVLGARAGRERYEQIKGMAIKVKDDPRVQAAAHQAADTARQQAPVVDDKVTSAASAPRRRQGAAPSGSSPTTTARAARPRQRRAPGQPLPAGRPALGLSRAESRARRPRWRR